MSGLRQRRSTPSTDAVSDEAQVVEFVPTSSTRTSVRARGESSDNPPVPEVICIDSDGSPRPRMTRPASNGRKMRRLNDSTPVIVVDDDEEAVAPCPSGRGNSINLVPNSREPRDASESVNRASSSSSVRPVAPRITRNRSQTAASSRTQRVRRIPPASALTDESPASWESIHNPAPIGNMPDPPAQARLPLPSAIFRNGQRTMRTYRYSRPDERGTSHSIRYRQVVLRVAAPTTQIGPRVVGRGGPRRARSPRRTNLNTSILQQLAQSVLESGARHFEVRYLGNDALPDYETLVSLDEQLLRERNAAPKNVIDRLPEVVATAADKELCCVICMSQVKEGESLRVLPCSHKYHKECIDGKLWAFSLRLF